MKLLLVQPKLSYDPGKSPKGDAPGSDDPGKSPAGNNHDVVIRTAARFAGGLGADDVVLLPEHFDLRPSRDDYEEGVRSLARELGCHVVGGSHHEDRPEGRVNSGVVADPRGGLVGSYEKVRPYAVERNLVKDGNAFGEFSIGGRNVLVLICADFWFSDLFARATKLPDVILVPAMSVTRKPTPDYSRALWRHLSIARAYEFGAYVGISDWAHVPTPERLFASGVGGVADPTAVDPDRFFTPIEGDARLYELDFEALAAFRRDRQSRGFFWKNA